jgi:hypothetical protein
MYLIFVSSQLHVIQLFLSAYFRLVNKYIQPLLCCPNVSYCIHKSMSLAPILCHINPTHNLLFYISKIHFDIILPSCLEEFCGLFPSDFRLKMSVFISRLRATYSVSSPLSTDECNNFGEGYKL